MSSKMEKCGQGKGGADQTNDNQSKTMVKKDSSTANLGMKKDEKLIAELKTQIPDVENIFNVHYRIGEGTFSTVFLASLKCHENVSHAKRKYFAVKHLIPTCHPSRMERELKCLLEIGGVDNIVGVDLCLRRADSVAFVMPYVPHDKFHDYFNKFDARELQSYMRNLLIALRRVHSFGIIHRDVKPSNFLHDRKNQKYLLVDFGLAQNVNHKEAVDSTNNHSNSNHSSSHGESSNNNNVSSNSVITTTTTTTAATPTTTTTTTMKKRKPSDIEETENSSNAAWATHAAKRQRHHHHHNNHHHQYSSQMPPLTAVDAASAATTHNNENAVQVSATEIGHQLPANHPSPPAPPASPTMSLPLPPNAVTIPSPFKTPLKQINEISTPKNAKKASHLDSPLTRHIKSAVLGYSIKAKMEHKRNGTGAIPPAAIKPTNSPAPSNPAGTPKYDANNRRSSAGIACFCYGKPTICNVCIIKKEVHASRAGTPGYRPPEVLLKHPNQTTAVDIWAVGVIMISILSACYPFFKGADDFTALAEMITVFGDEAIKKTALSLSRHVCSSQKKKPLHLRKLCVRLRNRSAVAPCPPNTAPVTAASAAGTGGKVKHRICDNCQQIDPECLCVHSLQNIDFSADIFPASAYDLMAKLLAINPNSRISADEALKHPFLQEDL